MYHSFLNKLNDIQMDDRNDDEYEAADGCGIESLQIKYQGEGDLQDLDGWSQEAGEYCEGGMDDDFVEVEDGKKKKKKKEKVHCCNICYLIGQKLFTFFFPGKKKRARTS